MKLTKVWGVVALATTALATSASATPFHFTITGVGIDASGTVTIDETAPFSNPYPCGTCAAGPGYMVTAISGLINGDAITGVAPLGSIAGNNNRLYPTSNPALDWGDLGFTTSSTYYNAFNANYAGHPGDFLAIGNQYIFTHPISFILSPVPEPVSWTLMLGGFGMIGAALRSRRTVSLRFA